eukprot:COSAG03_NODE_3439_length_2013_cov_32.426855_1_plen_96_part_10
MRPIPMRFAWIGVRDISESTSVTMATWLQTTLGSGREVWMVRYPLAPSRNGQKDRRGERPTERRAETQPGRNGAKVCACVRVMAQMMIDIQGTEGK